MYLLDRLLEALLFEEPEARKAWSAWRATIDIDSLPYASQQLLPALSPAFAEWLAEDPAAPIFKGIARQVWSRNQVRLANAVEVEALLAQSGVQALIAGPVAWALKTQPPAIREITSLTFLVPRAQVGAAWDALLCGGWEARSNLPSDQDWDFCDHASFQQEDLWLSLHWRLIQVGPEDAEECERVFLPRIDRVAWNRQTLRITSRAATMLHILCAERSGDLPWQADVALVGTAGIDWADFLDLAHRFAPLAIDRLRELHEFGRLRIPPLPRNQPGLARRLFERAYKAYRAHGYYRKEALSWPGFAEFVAVTVARKCAQAASPSRFLRK